MKDGEKNMKTKNEKNWTNAQRFSTMVISCPEREFLQKDRLDMNTENTCRLCFYT